MQRMAAPKKGYGFGRKSKPSREPTQGMPERFLHAATVVPCRERELGHHGGTEAVASPSRDSPCPCQVVSPGQTHYLEFDNVELWFKSYVHYHKSSPWLLSLQLQCQQRECAAL